MKNKLINRIIITLIFILNFNFLLKSQQIVGVYTPKKSLNIKNIFGKIPSYAYLKIKEDSTYYYETFWGSFDLDNEHGKWKFFNDTLLLIPTLRFSDTIKNNLEIQYVDNDSIKDGTRIQIMYLGHGLDKIKVKVFKDNELAEYYTDNMGYILLKEAKPDYAIIEFPNSHDCIDEKILFHKKKNDLVIRLDVKLFILKRKKLLNLENKIVGKKKITRI